MEALIHHFKLFTEGYHVPTGEVESVNLELYGGITYYRLFLSNVVGSFVNGEIVVNDDSTIECITQSPISSVDISSNSVSSYGGGGGVTHQVGDVVDLASSLGGIGGRGTVTSVSLERGCPGRLAVGQLRTASFCRCV